MRRPTEKRGGLVVVVKNSFFIGQRVRFSSRTWPPGSGVVDSIYTNAAGGLMYRIDRDEVVGQNRYAMVDEGIMRVETTVDRQVREAEEKYPEEMAEAREWVEQEIKKAEK